MIGFVIGLLTGGTVALVAFAALIAGKHADEHITENRPDSARLNKRKEERAKFLEEQEQQFHNLMQYTGKDQKE